jgi:putative DNA primase/helicase
MLDAQAEENRLEVARMIRQQIGANGIGLSIFDDWANRGQSCPIPADALQAEWDVAEGLNPNDLHPWRPSQPMTVKHLMEPYPLDALPTTIRAAVEEVAGFVKAPIPLVAISALTALSLAGQTLADIKRAERLQGPTGLFLLAIADSGERKTTCDGFFSDPIRQFEKEQAAAAEPLIRAYQAAMATWEAERDGILAAVKDAGKKGKSTDGLRRNLEELQYQKPVPPLIPKLLLSDETTASLLIQLGKRWPSAGVVSSEAGIVFGSHAMGGDQAMQNMATMNVLWDGGELSVGRKTSDSFVVQGARLTVALQTQEVTLREFFNRAGALARGTGFMARFLLAWPESTQGTRMFTEAPADWPHLAAFHRRITQLLNTPATLRDGALTPTLLELSPGAKQDWIAYHDAIEQELASGGELYDVRDVASKSADNAARLAALFQLFERGISPIDEDIFESASRIAAWHLSESRRFFGEIALPPEMADAARLDAWLIGYCREKKASFVGKNHLRQYGPIRDGKRLDAALKELSEAYRVQSVKSGKRTLVLLNPDLWR